MTDATDSLRELLESLTGALARHLDPGPTSVVLFGETARALSDDDGGALPRPAQLDILVVARELPPSRWDRHDLVYDALLEIEARRDAFAEATGWWPYLAIVLKTPGELDATGGLPAALEAGAWVVADEEGVFDDWRRRAAAASRGRPPRPGGRATRVWWDLAPGGDPDEVPDRLVELARSYLKQAEGRLLVTRVAREKGNYALVVRAAQEAVELSLKAMLARVGVDPPVWHDVGRELRQTAERLEGLEGAVVDELATISSKLREHREPAMYGDRLDRLGPEELFSEYDARVSRDWARQAFEIALELVNRLSLRD